MQEALLNQVGRSTLTDYKDYKVGPEDLLEVVFFGQDDLDREIRVNGQGEISLPLVETVPVAGLSPQEIEAKLKQMYREGRFIRNPQISVHVKSFRNQQVMVTGAVEKPGSYEVIGPRTLLEMLGKAGGLTDKAGDVVHVIRHQSAPQLAKAMAGNPDPSFALQSETVVIDLRRLFAGQALALNLPISNGDIVYVPHAKRAYVLGAVKKPGQVSVKENLTATQAIALTEGLDPMLASNRASILRLDENGQRVIIAVDFGSITNGRESDPVLKENDIVFVAESGLKRFLYNIKNLMPGALTFGASML